MTRVVPTARQISTPAKSPYLQNLPVLALVVRCPGCAVTTLADGALSELHVWAVALSACINQLPSTVPIRPEMKILRVPFSISVDVVCPNLIEIVGLTRSKSDRLTTVMGKSASRLIVGQALIPPDHHDRMTTTIPWVPSGGRQFHPPQGEPLESVRCIASLKRGICMRS